MTKARITLRTMTTASPVVHRPRAGAFAAIAPVVLAAAALAGCSDGAATTGADPVTSAATATANSQQLTMTDPWVKATQDSMTAAFGVLTNTIDTEIRIVSATTSVSDKAELHEVVTEDGEAMMRQKQDGFRVPAGDTHNLMPGGDHVMIMNLTEPVAAGDEVEVTLTAASGDTYTFRGLAKPFTGAKESYHSTGGDGTHSPSGSATDSDS